MIGSIKVNKTSTMPSKVIADKPEQCPSCGSKETRPHQGKRWFCHSCKKVWTPKNLIKAGGRKRLEKRPRPCPKCGSLNTYYDGLAKAEKGTKVKYCKCVDCGKRFRKDRKLPPSEE